MIGKINLSLRKIILACDMYIFKCIFPSKFDEKNLFVYFYKPHESLYLEIQQYHKIVVLPKFIFL